ncbi:MAG: thioredoxin-dependent thiol peroxidase [Gemmatimonadetes bacterium]|nr:thioredoxin-dependent thiol peroxidase [Gemmatimonadota bacterium]
MPKENDVAPDFELPTDTGEPLRLSDLRGRKVVLYFYPKDDTPGCTIQACSLRDGWSEIQRTGAVVLGVSPDSPRSHAKFREKYGLPFTLLADEAHEVAERYGVWVEKTMYGRKYWGNARTTFIIDEEGRIAKIFEKVKPEEHTAQVLAAL